MVRALCTVPTCPQQLTSRSRASAGTIAPIIVGVALLVVTGLYEASAKIRYPVFPKAIFRNIRGITLLQAGVFIVGIVFYATAIIWPLQIQPLYMTHNIEIGLYSGASGLGGFLLGPLFGIASRRLPHVRWQFVFALALLTLFPGAQAIVIPNSNVASTILVFLLFGFDAGAAIFSTAMVQLGVEHEYIGVATGILLCCRGLGGSVGSTIYTTTLGNKVASNIPKMVAVPLAKMGVPLAQTPAVIEALTSGNATSPALAALKASALYAAVDGLKLSTASAFRLLYLISIAFVVSLSTSATKQTVIVAKTPKTIDIKLDEGAHIHNHTDTGEGHIFREEDLVKQ